MSTHLHGLIPAGFLWGMRIKSRWTRGDNPLIALVPPSIAPERDKDAHPGDIRDLVEKVKKVYELHDASENHVQLFMPDDYYRFSTVSRQKMYSWLEKLPDLPVVNALDEADTGKTLAEDAAWCWFSDPRAVYHHGEKEAVYFGYINSRGM